ncbi:hypothetical protein RAC89_01700 [Paenibacillus sp. GD4]|uniref:hypothetical protein n=1 Tax=Paenibacillus sp. GD4 TaxID=3068890 RepID=UPI002796AD47|nr:hypothetical protein [Paenibacillus sp. GD4]MDQ1909212.1 hypothetical protein [Paenibacillus sp. GD4]
MTMIYSLLVFIHVLSALAAVGPFLVLIPMLRKLRTADDTQLPIYLDSFQYVVRLSKHTGHVLVFSGLLLMWIGQWPWTTPWIFGTFVVLFASLFFLARAFSPTLRRLREPDHDRSALVVKLSRSMYIYLFVLFIMLWLMIMKPLL